MSLGGPGFDLFGDEELANLADAGQKVALMRYRLLARDPDAESYVELAEQRLCEWHGVAHAVAMNSCTSALWVGLVAAGIGPGDIVLVPRFCFAATAAAPLYAGADVRFVDIDSTLSMSASAAEQSVCDRTRALIAVHMLGRPANMEALARLCDRRGLLLIEDAAQGCGATYHGRPVGGFGHFAVLSFNLFKTVTCGDGGALLTNRSDLFERSYAVHDHGWPPNRAGGPGTGPLIGLNLKMTNLAGAVLAAQLTRLPQIRQVLCERYARVTAILREQELPLATETDATGNLGNVAVLTLSDAAEATSLARAIGTKPLSESGTHLSWRMQLTPERLPRQAGRVHAPGSPDCASAELLCRSVALGIGLGDSYYGVPQLAPLTADPEELDDALEQLRAQLRAWRGSSRRE